MTLQRGSRIAEEVCVRQMKRFRPYLPIFWALVLNVTNLCWRVARQIAFPGRKKSGNLLTSVFVLFDGLIGQLMGCRRAMLGIPLAFTLKIPAREKVDRLWIFSKVWIRRGMLLAGWALFILSSLEWGGRGGCERADAAEARAAVGRVNAPTDRAVSPAVVAVAAPDDAVLWLSMPARVVAQPSVLPAICKRWLLLRNLRI